MDIQEMMTSGGKTWDGKVELSQGQWVPLQCKSLS